MIVDINGKHIDIESRDPNKFLIEKFLLRNDIELNDIVTYSAVSSQKGSQEDCMQKER